MKNVYLIQPNSVLSTAVYLPYSVGSIAAYSFQFEEITRHYVLRDFIFIKDSVSSILAEIEEPFIVGFSCYMWNIEYNLVLAKAVKEKWPDCVIVFGGPQIPDSVEYVEEYQYIDITIHGEGEIAFYSILIELLNDKNFSNINNISYRDNGVATKTLKTEPENLDNFPSPYAMGLFDELLKAEKHKNIRLDAILETNRGCPYGCIYCYWARSGSSFRKFPMERIKKDIEWMATHNIAYCVCADSNFGILDRDEEIADYVIEMKNKYGFPEKFETAAAKNKDDFTFRINQKLETSRLNRGVSVAVQSMSPETLEIIGRKNMSVNNLSEQLKKYRKHNIDTYTDLILGLPGESLDSFCRGLFEVIEAGQHYSVSVHRLELFPNTIICSDEMKKKYQIKTIRSQLCQHHSKILKDNSMSSRSEIVVQTSTMKIDEWKTALQTATCAQSFHCLGLLRFIAIYLRKAKNISYFDFYMGLYKWICSESIVAKRILDNTFKTVTPFLEGKGNLFFADVRFGDIYWAFDEGLFLSCVAEFDGFYDEIIVYLKKYFDDEILFNDIFSYQKEMIALPFSEYKRINTIYDWQGYFEHIFDSSFIEPERKQTTIEIAGSDVQTWEDYAREIVWYGRRSGRTINKAKECIR